MIMRYSIIGLFCEDIRQEQGGQETLIGILPNNINVKSIPGMLPKLCIYVRYHFYVDQRPKIVRSVFVGPDENEIMNMDIEETLIEETISWSKKRGQPILGIMSKATATPFPIEKEGFYKIVAEVDGEKSIVGMMDINVSED